MSLNWNEIRIRAAKFAKEWAGEGYEKGQTQLFYHGLFDVFGVPVRKVASFEKPVKKLGDKAGYIDLFWKGMLLVEQKSKGRDLVKAKTQALDYFPGLKDAELPRYLLLSDFQSFELYDLEKPENDISFPLEELPKYVERFGFVIGRQKREFRDQDPVNIKASELVGELHDALEEGGYTGHNLEKFLVRLVFCLFADDTGIFEPRDIFLDLLEQRTNEDGSDLGQWITKLFEVLDTPEDKRSKNLDEDLARFPYVNGDLFKEPLRMPDFNSKMRERLLDACMFDWSEISPAIFGSLFQSVMDAEERHAAGAHYTTEKNIMKVIEPLFLDGLRAEFKKIKARKDSRRGKELVAFHEKLASLKFFDPACGSGNFLIIAYREIRQLEIELLREIHAKQLGRFKTGVSQLPVHTLIKVDVDQFYGIEIGEFAARIAETAMWMMDHIMNNRLSLEFGQAFARIPLKKSPHILFADSLETDWETLLPASQCSYILGNPPFLGSKVQTDEQRAQVRRIAALGKTGGTLDYVAAWFILAAQYARKGGASVGFVSTNSITQGEQAAQLWPIIFDRCKMEVIFAHRTFAWGSDAKGKAHVHVVIVGLSATSNAPAERRLFVYDDINGDPEESSHKAISPYLFDAGNLTNPHMVVKAATKPLNDFPRLKIGSKPIDGGHFILNEEEHDALLHAEPGAKQFLHPYIGSREFLNGGERWIVDLNDASPKAIRGLPKVREMVASVKEYRLGNIPAKGKDPAKIKKPGQSSLALADTPTQYHVHVRPENPFLIVPRHSSENREYVPFGWAKPPTIASDAVLVILEANPGIFGLMTSAMHMSWLRHIGGRIKSDYRYSAGMVFNTFPMPPRGFDPKKIEPYGKKILTERDKHTEETLADLYETDLMPAGLKKAHKALDVFVDSLYRRKPFSSDLERAEFLLSLYEKQIAPLVAASQVKKRKPRKKKTS